MRAHLVLPLAIALFACSCASSQMPRVPTSPQEMSRLLIGRWFQGDVAGRFEMPHRFELTLASDGTCAYYYIPKDSAQPGGIRRGTWQLGDGPSVVFRWGERSFAVDYRVHTGRIHHLDRRELMIEYPAPHGGFQSFYRRYTDSVTTVP